MAQVRARAVAGLTLGTLAVGFSLLGALRFVLAERARGLASTMPASASAEPRLALGQSLPGRTANAQGAPSSDATAREGVYLRITDELDQAHWNAPRLSEPKSLGALTEHWRRHRTPFAGPRGETGKWVQAIGLERQRRTTPRKDEHPKETGDESEQKNELLRRTQTFGLAEGSFDEREAIVLPPPGRLRLPVSLPKGARLRLAPAVLGEGNVRFVVSFRPAAANRSRVLWEGAETGPSKHWIDREISLDEVGAGELEFSTEASAGSATVALLGSPTILAPGASPLPYNVVFVIVDAMRGDAIAEAHDPEDDARRARAKYPPLDAWIAPVPAVTPHLNALARRGVVFQNVWSAAMWTRPATVAMLSGRRASHLGLSVLDLELFPEERRRFYASDPPMLPRYFRAARAHTAAIVNNMYLCGSVGVGVDYAFESLVDHRYQALDTQAITEDALRYLEAHRNERFLLLLNYASPHSPYVPPPVHLKAIEKSKGLPADPTVRNYLAEIHKDDAAIGQVLERLALLGLDRETLVVVTADHGETMSEAHDAVAIDVAKGVPSGRFTHLSTMWEEAARVGLVMALPPRLPAGARVKERVQTLDLVPTILELEGLAAQDRFDGRSLVGLFSGQPLEDRPVIVEGRAARAIQLGRHRLIVRERVAQRLKIGKSEIEKAVELYDLELDPGERKDIAREHPDVVRRLREELEHRLTAEQNTGSAPASEGEKTRWHLRFATGQERGRVDVALFLRGVGANAVDLRVASSDLDARAIRRDGQRIVLSFDASPAALRDIEVEAQSTTADLGWEIRFEGRPWPRDRFYGGLLGIALTDAESGLAAQTAPGLVESASLPHVALGAEFGLFVTREPRSGSDEVESSAEAQLEAEQAMQAWGYARKPTKATTK
jgi:arylsulfatase A-like enzyme